MSADESYQEEQLIERAMAGDRLATEQLLLHYYDRLVRHIQRRMPNELKGLVQAEDILQQSYVRAFRAIGEFEPRAAHSFYGWLKTIADRQLIDVQRRRYRERRAKSQKGEAGSGESSWAASLLDRVAIDGASVSRGARRREAMHALQVALASLTEEYRQVIRLRYVEDRSLAEIAASLDRTEDAVRGLLHRAKKKLRDALGRASAYLSSG